MTNTNKDELSRELAKLTAQFNRSKQIHKVPHGKSGFTKSKYNNRVHRKSVRHKDV